jgi:ABC-type antimicrobial peptide transport system permease subunit
MISVSLVREKLRHLGIVAGSATAGLYGVMAFGVDRRTREIGVRRALGAQGRQVLRDVFGRSLLQLGMGLVLGVAAGIAFVRLLSASLLDSPSLRIIASADPLAVLVALGVLVAAAVLATLPRPPRAARSDGFPAPRMRSMPCSSIFASPCVH